eukprot:8645181-Pyramimonas_sp.AAC.1
MTAASKRTSQRTSICPTFAASPNVWKMFKFSPSQASEAYDGPGCLQDGLKTTHEAPKRAPIRPHIAEDAPKTALRLLKRVSQESPKSAPQ